MILTLLRAVGLWLVIVVAAIINGLFREWVLVPLVGPDLALPASGLLLCILVVGISIWLVSFLHTTQPRSLLLVGLFWVALTLAFELLFGHFVAGKSWQEIMLVFNVARGDLFVLVLLVTGIAPLLGAKARKLL